VANQRIKGKSNEWLHIIQVAPAEGNASSWVAAEKPSLFTDALSLLLMPSSMTIAGSTFMSWPRFGVKQRRSLFSMLFSSRIARICMTNAITACLSMHELSFECTGQAQHDPSCTRPQACLIQAAMKLVDQSLVLEVFFVPQSFSILLFLLPSVPGVSGTLPVIDAMSDLLQYFC
jgi:hypothetical protein